PSPGQWLGIRRLTPPAEWTPPERKMMRAAARHHGLRAAAIAVCLAIVGSAGLVFWSYATQQRNASHAAALVQQLDTADIAHVPTVVADLADYRRWADPLLQQSFDKAAPGSHEKLHASLALLPVDPNQANFLCDRLLDADPHEVAVLIDALAPFKGTLTEKLWQAATVTERGKESRRLRAASALAAFDPQGDRWPTIQSAVVDDLVTVPIVHLGLWTKPLRPVRKTLLVPLSVVFSDPNRREIERSLATDILADYAADEPRTLADLLLESDSRQFGFLFPIFKKHEGAGLPKVIAEIDRKWGLGMTNEGNEILAQRCANAAIVLLRMDRPEKAWPILRNSVDPRARSYMIHRLGPYGADPHVLLERLELEADVSVRRALILSLGEFGDNQFPIADRKSATATMQSLYRTDADPGVHAAAEWLLRTWKQDAWLKRTEQQLAQPESAQNPRLDDIRRNGAKGAAKGAAKETAWYVNGKGQTMVAIAGPVEFRMGSPKMEPGRALTESLRIVRIERTFALASKPVTMEQYKEFDPAYRMEPKFHRLPDLPVVGTSWFEAAAYCNWLSEQEGIDPSQWCYEKDAAGKITRLKRDNLSLLGYRLPTEAEMEYAT
ncbi:MAG TPA: SUMF1/EgtB/PvdO family nonheme iron enzyme, partial [Gemmataceae bacterium]|nr:SUMF1/EgtB/PvdO family nonheme iron enzyme [Gemmataceae bacterium]